MLRRLTVAALLLPIAAFADLGVITAADYPGQLVSNGEWVRASTRFEAAPNGSISGRYAFLNGPDTEQGLLSRCRLTGRDMRCVWLDAYGTGTFAVQFSGDFTSFKGGWFDTVLDPPPASLDGSYGWQGAQ